MHLLFSPYHWYWTLLLNGVKAIFKLKFSSINLLMTIAVVAFFWEYPEAAVVITLCFR
jgi:Cd2+/Zn2+-exporting ATPase